MTYLQKKFHTAKSPVPRHFLVVNLFKSLIGVFYCLSYFYFIIWDIGGRCFYPADRLSGRRQGSAASQSFLCAFDHAASSPPLLRHMPGKGKIRRIRSNKALKWIAQCRLPFHLLSCHVSGSVPYISIRAGSRFLSLSISLFLRFYRSVYNRFPCLILLSDIILFVSFIFPCI